MACSEHRGNRVRAPHYDDLPRLNGILYGRARQAAQAGAPRRQGEAHAALVTLLCQALLPLDVRNHRNSGSISAIIRVVVTGPALVRSAGVYELRWWKSSGSARTCMATVCAQGHIVAELTSVDNQNLVALVGSKDVHTVVSHDIIG